MLDNQVVFLENYQRNEDPSFARSTSFDDSFCLSTSNDCPFFDSCFSPDYSNTETTTLERAHDSICLPLIPLSEELPLDVSSEVSFPEYETLPLTSNNLRAEHSVLPLTDSELSSSDIQTDVPEVVANQGVIAIPEMHADCPTNHFPQETVRPINCDSLISLLDTGLCSNLQSCMINPCKQR